MWSLIRFWLVFVGRGGGLDPYYSANKCKHATSIDHAAGGRWQPHKLWLLIIFGMSENNQKRLLTMC